MENTPENPLQSSWSCPLSACIQITHWPSPPYITGALLSSGFPFIFLRKAYNCLCFSCSSGTRSSQEHYCWNQLICLDSLLGIPLPLVIQKTSFCIPGRWAVEGNNLFRFGWNSHFHTLRCFTHNLKPFSIHFLT